MNTLPRWRWVPGYEGLYKVTSFGKVFGIKRRKYLTPVSTKSGHLWVALWRGNKYKAKFVHCLVLEAFVGSCPPGMECRHLDGVSSNNNLKNLKWGTKKENAADRELHGRTVKGVNFWSAKMNPTKVKSVRNMYRTGKFSIRKLGTLFGISFDSTRAIINRRTWKHVS